MTGRRFLVSCLQCRRPVAIVLGIADAVQLDQLRGHLLACRPGAVPNLAPGVETILGHFRVVPTDADDEPPPGAA